MLELVAIGLLVLLAIAVVITAIKFAIKLAIRVALVGIVIVAALYAVGVVNL